MSASHSRIATFDLKATTRRVVLAGNPNSGKTTLFNALTGMWAKVGNYPGVTVERKEGRLLGAPADRPIVVLDLPGTYSLSPQSLDEQIARDVLLHRLAEVPAPDVVVVVVDASNLQRNLYFATQVIELGYPTCLALNMVDVARENGHQIDAGALERRLGVPVMPIVASKGEGVAPLRQRLMAMAAHPPTRQTVSPFCALPPEFNSEMATLTQLLGQSLPQGRTVSPVETLLLLSDEKFLALSGNHYPANIAPAVTAARTRLEKAGLDWRSAAIEARYTRIAEIQQEVTTETLSDRQTVSDRLDRVFTHRIWGLLIFVGLMALMFQSIFTFAELPMKGLEQGVDWVGRLVGA